MELGEKLRGARRDKGLTQKRLGEMMGVSDTAVSKWESNTNIPDIEQVTRLAEILEKDIKFFASDSWIADMRKVGGDSAFLPVIGEIACGAPILATQNVEYYKEVLKQGLPNGELFYLIARGDSMEPRIFDGDSVLIRIQPSVENGEIAAVQLEDDTKATLKRVQYSNGDIVLTSFNPNYPPIVLNKNNPGRIIGRALRIESDL